MPTIIIHRTSEYVNRLRDYSIYIEGIKVGTIGNGETKEFLVSPGHHSIVTKIDWCGSKTITFDISTEEVKEFKVGGFKCARWLMPAAVVIIVLSYIVNLKYGFDYLFYLVVSAFLLSVYYLTAGRKRYLTLTETKTERHGKLVLQ